MKTYPSIPNEAVQDAADHLALRVKEQSNDNVLGHFHVFMLENGCTLTTHFIPHPMRTVENFEHIRKDVIDWLDEEIAALKQGG